MSVVSNPTKKPSIKVTYLIILLVMCYYLITTLQVRKRIQFRVLTVNTLRRLVLQELYYPSMEQL